MGGISTLLQNTQAVPWPISVTHVIITTGHPIFTICHTIINKLMLLSARLILLSHASRYYQYNSCYLLTKCILLSTTHAIINNMMLCSTNYYQQNPSYYQTTHIQTPQQLMLLSNTSCYYQHLNLLSLHSISYYYLTGSPGSSWRNW